MPRIARFHLDPTVHQVSECLDADCQGEREHHEIEVRGEHSEETYVCEHQVNHVIWHALTPTSVPAPTCDEPGCEGMLLV